MFPALSLASPMCRPAHDGHTHFPKTPPAPCHFPVPESLVDIFVHLSAWNSGSSSMRSPSTFIILCLSLLKKFPVHTHRHESFNFSALTQAPTPLHWQALSLLPNPYEVSPSLGSLPLPPQPTPQCCLPPLCSPRAAAIRLGLVRSSAFATCYLFSLHWWTAMSSILHLPKSLALCLQIPCA